MTLSLFMMFLRQHIPIVALSPTPSNSLSISFPICLLQTAGEAFQIALQHSADIWRGMRKSMTMPSISGVRPRHSSAAGKGLRP